MGWSYTEDRQGTGDYLKFDVDLKAELARRGELGLSIARALAPRLKTPRRDRVVGELAASGQVTDDGVGGFFHDRMQLSVTFDVPEGYAAAATWPHRRGGGRGSPNAKDYLLAALPAIERG